MSRLVWDYEDHDGNVVAQCAYVGNKVHDDGLGQEGVAVRIDGSSIVVEFLEDGERVEKPRTKGHVKALVQVERAQTLRTGRRQAVTTDDADCLRTCQLVDGVEGRTALKTDRAEVIDALNSHLTERFQKVLDDPILDA
jgi:hypothetical protein